MPCRMVLISSALPSGISHLDYLLLVSLPEELILNRPSGLIRLQRPNVFAMISVNFRNVYRHFVFIAVCHWGSTHAQNPRSYSRICASSSASHSRRGLLHDILGHPILGIPFVIAVHPGVTYTWNNPGLRNLWSDWLRIGFFILTRHQPCACR